jgi:CubicO group peptidase (beta-lactamase class C family)
VFQYANASSATAMRVLASRVGDVGAFVSERLFAPLGIEDVHWRRAPDGSVAGGEGIALRTGELAELGRLIRDGGVRDGRRVVSSRWCDAMHDDWVRRDDAGPGYDRYAMAGWGGPGRLWRLHGAYGQMLLFDDDRDAAVDVPQCGAHHDDDRGRHREAGTVVTVTADDHLGADAFAAAVAAELG